MKELSSPQQVHLYSSFNIIDLIQEVKNKTNVYTHKHGGYHKME